MTEIPPSKEFSHHFLRNHWCTLFLTPSLPYVHLLLVFLLQLAPLDWTWTPAGQCHAGMYEMHSMAVWVKEGKYWKSSRNKWSAFNLAKTITVLEGWYFLTFFNYIRMRIKIRLKNMTYLATQGYGIWKIETKMQLLNQTGLIYPVRHMATLLLLVNVITNSVLWATNQNNNISLFNCTGLMSKLCKWQRAIFPLQPLFSCIFFYHAE